MMWVKRIGCVIAALVLFEGALSLVASWQDANQKRFESAAEALR